MTLRDKVKAIVFDVDETLTEGISWFRLTEGLGGSTAVHEKIIREMQEGKLNYLEAKDQILHHWQQTGNANKKFMHRMFLQWGLLSDAKEIIDYLRPTYELCLISGAMDLRVQVVAELLNIPEWYANTDLVWDGKGDLIDLHYQVDQDGDKVKHFQEFIKRHGLSKEETAAVGDGGSDKGLFETVGYPILVEIKERPELKKLAYRTVKTLEELKEVF